MEDFGIITEDERDTVTKTKRIFVGYVIKFYDLQLAVDLCSLRESYVAWHVSHQY